MAWYNPGTWWSGRTFSARDPELYYLEGGGENWAGEVVSSHQAFQLSAFLACTKVAATTIASLSLDVMERQADGTKVRVTDHPLARVLDASPNSEQTPVEFWEGRVIGLYTSGNGYAEIKRSGRNDELVSLEPMPAYTGVSRDSDYNLIYTFSDRGKEYRLPADKVLHIKAFGDGDLGLSPISYAAQSLGLAKATEKFTGNTFSKGGRVRGFFVTPENVKLSPEQRDEARKNLIERNMGENAPWASILEGGVKFEKVSMTMHDAETLLNRRFNIEEICRFMGVPPILIGHAAEGQTMWGTGVSAIMQSWYTLHLRSMLKRIEQAVEKRVLTPVERLKYSVKFNIEDLLRGDTTARATFYVQMLNSGVFTINYVRKLEGLPPVEGGDVPRMQMQNVPITTGDTLALMERGGNGNQTTTGQ